jgi:precorrin-3B C17-methyltransferase
VQQYTGTGNVCEAAAILSSGDCELIVPKTGLNRKITLAITRIIFDEDKIPVSGKLFLVGLGPGDIKHMTFRAREAIECSDVVVGYDSYVKLIEPYLIGKKVISTGMGKEVQRVKTALELAGSGKVVALLSSGDTGIYGMAGLVGEVLNQQAASSVNLEIVPGIPLLAACASLLGSPITGDFVSISLSDYLVTWQKIESRLRLAAQGDFVIVIYNPKSKKRQNQLTRATKIISHYRAGTTPVGIVTNAYRQQQKIITTDLAHMLDYDIDMNTTLIIGNSTTFNVDGLMVTPRGYHTKYNLYTGV